MSRSVRDDYQWKGRPGDGPHPASIDPLFPAAHYQDGRDLKPCQRCLGTGRNIIHPQACATCQGTGYLTK